MYFTQATLRLLDSLKGNLPQSLLLTGEPGVALEHAITHITPVRGVIRIEPDTTRATPMISVDAIRQLYDQTKSKYTDRRVVVIAQADTMSASAQAAFLKLLEEPGANVHFILVSHAPEVLLPTIRSRTQAHTIARLSDEESLGFIRQHGVSDERKTTQLMYLAAGRSAELERLILDEEHFTKSAARIKDAQVLLGADAYQKLALAHRYKDDRAAALQLVDAAALLARKSLSGAPAYSTIEQLEQLTELRTALEANQNIRLAFARFVV